MRLVFFDLETGGLDPQNHPIIQLAAVAVDDRLQILKEIEIKVEFDLRKADPQALEMNRYSRDVWAAEAYHPLAAEANFSRFLSEFADVEMVSQKSGKLYKVAQLIGHNSDSFDGPFLQAWYKRLRKFLPAAFRTLCTYQKALHHFQDRPHLPRPENFKLEGLCKYFGVELSGAHDALADCRATVGLYRALRSAEARIPPECIDFGVDAMLTGPEPAEA
jgi:DNA polymerase III epsilon subunit-like protein